MARRSADPTSLYKMDDYLNKLSIDQLRSELQRPTGGAPAFMVASKLQEKLREKSAAAQRPASTVAEDLMGGQAAMQRPQEAGINSLMPRDPARTAAMMPRDVAADHEMEPMAMAHGGVIKMAAGDVVEPVQQYAFPSFTDSYAQSPVTSEDVYQNLSKLSDSDLNRYLYAPSGPQVDISRLPATREQLEQEIQRRQIYRKELGTDAYRSVMRGNISQIPPSGPRYAGSDDTGAITPETPVATITSSPTARVNDISGVSEYETSAPAIAATTGLSNLPIPPSQVPAPQQTRGSPGLGSLASVGAGGRGGAGFSSGAGAMGGPGGMAAGAPGGLPSISGGMAGSPTAALQARMEASDAEYDKVMKEMRENRPNKEQLKEDAKWRFLAQLGAGMAAGTGNFARAFGGALGPAMQSYGEEMKSIRKEIQESYKGDLDAYKAKSEALYRSGKLSQDEFHVRMQVAGQLEAARIHAGATMAASGARHAGQFTDQQKADMLLSDDPKVRAVGEQLFGRYHQRDFASEAKERIAHNIQTEFRAELATLTNNLPSVGQSATQRRQEIENQLRDKYNKMYLDRLMAVGASGISSAPAGNILGSYGSGNP